MTISRRSFVTARTRALLSLSVLAVAAARATAQTPTVSDRAADHVILITIDGLRPQVYLDAEREGVAIPNLKALLQAGSGADGVVVAYPSMTYQHCFRARVSPKPWRIGVDQHIRPRPGVWPVQDEHLARRNHWIDGYEQAARHYASCRFIEEVGSRIEHHAARAVRELHDDLCRSDSNLPIA